VKILSDAQLPPGLKVMLIAAGHEACHVANVGLRDASDAMVWEYADTEGAAILTKGRGLRGPPLMRGSRSEYYLATRWKLRLGPLW
jgi:predicted nuclease of predicted toxin-antitoxin system